MNNISTADLTALKNEIKEEIQKVSVLTKETLTTSEAAFYMGVSMSYLYKLTMRKEIPHYKPNGKMCYFSRKELDNWMTSNRIATNEELEQRAQTYCAQKGGYYGRN